jgi:hypothetical protein
MPTSASGDLDLLGHSSVLLEVVKENLGPYDPTPATTSA